MSWDQDKFYPQTEALVGSKMSVEVTHIRQWYAFEKPGLVLWPFQALYADSSRRATLP